MSTSHRRADAQLRQQRTDREERPAEGERGRGHQVGPGQPARGRRRRLDEADGSALAVEQLHPAPTPRQARRPPHPPAVGGLQVARVANQALRSTRCRTQRAGWVRGTPADVWTCSAMAPTLGSSSWSPASTKSACRPTPSRVLEWGPPDGRLVVALHGFPDTAWTWRHVAPLLADAGLRVAAPFLRGYAPSEIPADRDYSVRALAADAVALHAAARRRAGRRTARPRLGRDHDQRGRRRPGVAVRPARVAGGRAVRGDEPEPGDAPPVALGDGAAAASTPGTSRPTRCPACPSATSTGWPRGCGGRGRRGTTRGRISSCCGPPYPTVEHARAVVSYYRAMLGSGHQAGARRAGGAAAVPPRRP